MDKLIRLYTRGDDCGSSQSANKAILEACETGILKNVSFMMPAPYIEEAAQMFSGHKELCFGLHVTMNSEWDSLKWGPISESYKVSSLIDNKNGFLFQTTKQLKENNPKLDEIMLETEAQLDKATRLGLDIKYAEMHMAFGWVADGLNDAFNSWCNQKGIINSIPLGERLPKVEYNGNPVEMLIEQLKIAKPGYYTLIGHPAYDNEEMRDLGHEGFPGHTVALSREWERRIFCDKQVVDYCEQNGVIPLRYDEV